MTVTEDRPFVERLALASFAELETLWQETLAEFMRQIGVPENQEQAAEALRRHPFYQGLEADWLTLPSKAREDRYARLLELLERVGYETRPFCLRCGACCQGSSPSLFLEDKRLFDEGLVTRAEAVTLRAGERVRLPLGQGSQALSEETIKLREDPETGYCLFYDSETRGCRIYLERPLQCRAQACWDTSDVESVLRKEERLTRAHLVSPDEPVAPALPAHEARCSVLGLAEAFEDLANGKEDALDVVIAALAYDTELRPLLRDKLPLPEAELEFTFGRPLVRVVEQFGVRVVPDGEGYRLEPLPREPSTEETSLDESTPEP